MIRLVALALAALSFAAAASAGPQDAARDAVAAYRLGHAAAMFDVEAACWRAARRDTVADCVHRMIAGGIVDGAMQQVERRGPTEAFAPAAQRARYMREARRIGMGPDEAQATLEAIVKIDTPFIVKGLTESGLRLY